VKHKIIILTLLFVSSALTAGSLFLPKLKAMEVSDEVVIASPRTIWVPDNYTKMQWAIGNASDGDTIFVRAGTYYENIVVEKSLSLTGENKSITIIDGNRTGDVVSIQSDFATIEGFTIRNSGLGLGLPSGINVGSLGNCTIINNIITSNGKGISLLFSGNNTIINNTISSNDYGIYIVYSMNNTIFHNYFLNNRDQVYTTGSINKWDDGYPNGGNYWSDYEDKYSDAKEKDGSGIWNTPYVISEFPTNRDNYPLIPEFPSALILPLLMILTLTVTMLGKRVKTHKIKQR